MTISEASNVHATLGAMWPFRKKEEGSAMKRLVTGLIIGGAIGSIIGNAMMEKHEQKMKEEEEDEEEE